MLGSVPESRKERMRSCAPSGGFDHDLTVPSAPAHTEKAHGEKLQKCGEATVT